MKQTAVEWLMDKLPTIDKYDPYYEDIIQQAKAMEKEQITAFAKLWEEKLLDGRIDSVDDLYNESYGAE